jgi:hypothetical protein
LFGTLQGRGQGQRPLFNVDFNCGDRVNFAVTRIEDLREWK